MTPELRALLEDYERLIMDVQDMGGGFVCFGCGRPYDAVVEPPRLEDELRAVRDVLMRPCRE